MSCPLCEKNQLTRHGHSPYLIHEFNNSFLYLGDHQYYAGYSVLVTKDHYREMTDIPLHVRSEVFQEMMKSHEVIEKVFRPKKMNMCSLGNVVDHIHWHFFPRYADDQNFKNPPWLQMHLFHEEKISFDLINERIIQMKKEFSSF